MKRDAEATRIRILDAAVDEFAAYGLAGGRIERIATASGANVRSIYQYFGNKEQLFHAAVYKVLHAIGEAVPLTEDDLPGFAGRRFDQLMRHPKAVRLHYWRQLEAPQAGPDDRELYAAKVARMERMAEFNTHAAANDAISPADMLILVNHMAAAWVSLSGDFLTADGTDPSSPVRIAAHRAALVEGVRRLLTARHPRPNHSNELPEHPSS